MAEGLFKRLIEIGGLGLARAYDGISGIAPGAPQLSYFGSDITPCADVLPAPTAWDQFRLANDTMMRSVNGGAFARVVIPATSAPQLLGFDFSDLILNGQFHEYHIGPPPLDEIWRIHGVNFTFIQDARLQIQSFETVQILDTDVVGISSSRYFGQNETGIFYPGPPASIVNVKAEPKPWDMMNNGDLNFPEFPQLLINVRNDAAVADLRVLFHVAITRMIRAVAPTPPR